MPKPWSTAGITEQVLAGWRSLHPEGEQLVIAGFSFGGLIAGQLAAALGSECRRCILIGASGFGPLHVQADLLPPPTADAQAGVAEAIHRENLTRLMFHNPAMIDALAVHIHADNLAQHRLRSRGMAGSNDLAEVLQDIPARLVGIWGEYDATAGGRKNLEARAKLFRAAQPDAEFHVLPDVGHWAMYEAASEVNRLMLAR
jgi:pimeloyl-ACP methyl ester carboxylesterase